MRNIYEKLRHFDEVILKDAAAERDKILRQIETDYKVRIAREKKKLEEQAKQLLEKESVQAEIEKNNIISQAIISSRQLMVKKRNEIVGSVYNDTKKLLEDFVKKDEYLPYFLKSINNALSMAGGDDAVVYLTAADMQRFARQLEQLRKEFPFQITFEQTGDDIIGGCKVYSKNTDVVADETLAGKLESNKERILEICDLKI